MEKEIAAALKAAKAYKIRNEGERSSVELIRAMLEDCHARLALLDVWVDDYERQAKIRKAEDELRKAQSA